MNQSSLETLATRLAAHLDCTQDVACRQIMQVMIETGQPLPSGLHRVSVPVRISLVVPA